MELEVLCAVLTHEVTPRVGAPCPTGNARVEVVIRGWREREAHLEGEAAPLRVGRQDGHHHQLLLIAMVSVRKCV